jgi:glycosyltransferase involved in cell wall biosynthesis
VTTVSTRPGSGTVETSDVGRRILHAQISSPLLQRLRIRDVHTFGISCLRTLLSLDADVVHGSFYTDWLAAGVTKRWKQHRVVLQLNGIPVPGALYRRWPPERWMVRAALRRRDRLIVCSRFVADGFVRYYNIEPEVVHCPVNVDEFAVGAGPADGRPTLLAVSDFDVPRKGVRVLVRAFAQVKRDVPALRLRLSGRISEAVRKEVLDDLPVAVRGDVELLGLGQPGDVPRQYREATLFVLPSMWEPSGGAMLEAFASGTPVVAADHGGLPEFVENDVGTLFDPGPAGEEATNADGLARAIRAGLELAEDPGARKRCRAYAERFSWPALGPTFERVYTS